MIEFNKKLMMDNISVLLKKKDMKIGELESQANVSTGYLSRLAKDENSKPGVDLVAKIAAILGVSLDVLLYCNLSSQNFTERYLVEFLQKLNKDTLENRLGWNKETPEMLSYYGSPDGEGNINHPLFAGQIYKSRHDPEHSKDICKIGPYSKLFDNQAYAYGDWFGLEMKGKSFLFLIDVHEIIYDPQIDVHSGLELWLCLPHGPKECLCTTADDSFISSKLRELHETLEMCIQLDRDVKNVIDAFMHEE